MSRRVKRYTRIFEDCYVVSPNNLRRNRLDDFVGPAVEKLAEYEDTDLTPTQVAMMQKEVQLLRSRCDMLNCRVEELEADLASTRSEREYFRSRAEFFQEVAGAPGGCVGGKK